MCKRFERVKRQNGGNVGEGRGGVAGTQDRVGSLKGTAFALNLYATEMAHCVAEPGGAHL